MCQKPSLTENHWFFCRMLSKRPKMSTHPPELYQICLQGTLDPGWSEWLSGMQVCPNASGNTVLTGPLADQAALHGLLKKLRDVGLPLLSLQRLEPPERTDT